jgi:hypothetical protein
LRRRSGGWQKRPRPAEWLAVYERATKNGLIEGLSWGDETLQLIK